MEWIELNKDKLPETKVLAANFKSHTYGFKEKLIGTLYVEDNRIVCESDNEILENCTHYIPINDFDIKL